MLLLLRSKGNLAPLTRTAFFALAALTLHYSVLSIVLHLSRSRSGARYHASSAVVLTELGKILVAILLVFGTRELRGRVHERKRERERAEVLDAGVAESLVAPAWLEGDGEKPPSTVIPIGRSRRADKVEGVHRRSSSLRVSIPVAQGGRTILSPIPASPSSAQIDTPQSSTTQSPVTPLPLEPHAHFAGLLDVFDWDAWAVLRETTFAKGWWRLAVPSICFVFQANLQYVASANLSVPLFQLAYQLKIPATALWSVILLSRSLLAQQWFALFLLTAGVGVVQISSNTQSSASSTPAPTSYPSPSDPTKTNELLGLVTVLIACISSGFSSCYLEKILKSSSSSSSPSSPPSASSPPHLIPSPTPSLWIRNIQLSLFGLLACVPVVAYDMRGRWDIGDLDGEWWERAGMAASSLHGSFFEGFDGVAWMVVGLQVSGGLLGALVTQHADSILKGFATSLSILISAVLSIFLFQYHVSLGGAVGAALVLASTWAYTQPGGRWAGLMGRKPNASAQAPLQPHGHSLN